MDDCKIYDAVGTEAGTLGDGQEVVGLLFPHGTSELDGFDTRYMTLPAAKALLIDLRDAIEYCVERSA